MNEYIVTLMFELSGGRCISCTYAAMTGDSEAEAVQSMLNQLTKLFGEHFGTYEVLHIEQHTPNKEALH